MNSSIEGVVHRLNMLGLACDGGANARFDSAVAALSCFPMYMIANVHAWTAETQFKVPLLDIPGSEAIREAIEIGRQEGRITFLDEHRAVVDSMLAPARPPDRVVYEYALETLKDYFRFAPPALAASLRAMIGRSIVAVASASGKNLLGTGGKVSQGEHDCLARIADELDLASSPIAAAALASVDAD